MRVTNPMILLLLAAIGCSGPADPHSSVTVLVTNATCSSGSCAPLQLLGFPSNQPRTPGGLWSIDLGLVRGPSACVTLPPSGVFRVIGVSKDGTADTTTFTWTPADPISLGAQLPTASLITASPSTSAFVPASAPGWKATLPGDSAVSRATECTP